MRIDRTLPLKILWLVYAVMWTGGVLHLPDPGWAAPVFLFLAGLIALLSEPGEWKPLLTAAAAGFTAEVIGVHTGIPFGSYVYTGALGPSLLGVPLAIACAWMVLFAFVRQWTSNIAVGAALLTATDLVIDPSASGSLGYWRWVKPGPYFGVPLSNFAGWFCVSLLLFVVCRRPAGKSLSQRVLGASILLFFVLIL